MGGDTEVDALPMPHNGVMTWPKRWRGKVMGSEAALQTTAPLILVTMQAATGYWSFVFVCTDNKQGSHPATVSSMLRSDPWLKVSSTQMVHCCRINKALSVEPR